MRHLQALCILIVSLSNFSFAARAEEILREGFENGLNGWQVMQVAGSMGWDIEDSKATYPSDSYEGTHRIAFRNPLGITSGSISRLISPVMDLSYLSHPVLQFAYAQPAYTGDVDTLRIYYRTSASAAWVMLDDLHTAASSWRIRSIELPALTSTYQVMFEAVDNLGHGIAVDDIRITQQTPCETPVSISINDIGEHGARITWSGSLSADSFQIILSEQTLLNPELAENTAADTIITDFQLRPTTLTCGRTYHAYIRSFCQEAQSGWGHAVFTTLCIVRHSLPYTETFDMTYSASRVGTPDGWTCVGSLGNAQPFINRSTPISQRPLYAADSTTALCFAGNAGCSLPLTAGARTWAATPQLEVTPDVPLHIRFHATGSSLLTDRVRSRIVVGILSNPENISTFVAADTIEVDCINQYKAFDVYIPAAGRRGQHVAFLSAWDHPNTIFIDSLTIDTLNTVERPSHIHIDDLCSDGRTISLRADLHQADSWNILISKDYVSDGSRPASVLQQVDNISTSSVQLDVYALAGQWVNIYAQAAKSGRTSTWSEPLRCLIPTSLTAFPKRFDLEPTDSAYGFTDCANALLHPDSSHTTRMPVGLLITPLARRPVDMPTYTGSNTHSSSHVLLIKGQDKYVVLPRIPDSTPYADLLMTARIRAVGSTGSARVEVGMMDNPADTSSFQTVATWEGTDVYRFRFAHFGGYRGHGRYVAIKSTAAAIPYTDEYDTYASACYIDDIRIDSTQCLPPMNIEAVVSDTSLQLRWDAGAEQQCRVLIGTCSRLDRTCILTDSITGSNTALTCTHLKRDTPYYYTIINRCGNDTYASDTFEIRTECGRFHTPYKEDFEQLTGGYMVRSTPSCWDINYYTYGTTNHFPFIQSQAETAHSGLNSLYLGKTASASTPSYAVLPAFDKPVRQLQLRLHARMVNQLADGHLYVALVDDNWDYDDDDFRQHCFDTIDIPADHQYHLISTDFTSYTGNRTRICLKNDVGQPAILIDDIEVADAPECEEVSRIEVEDVSASTVTLQWQSRRAQRWDVQIMADTLAGEPDYFITTDENRIHAVIPGMHPNTDYYARVRAHCPNDGQYGPWSDRVQFRTSCSRVGLPYTETFEDLAPGFAQDITPECWSMTRTYYNGRYTPFVYESERYAYEGSKSLYFGVDHASVNRDLYVVMPQMADSICKLEISLQARLYKEQYPDTIFVGTVMQPDDPELTFQIYDTLAVSSENYRQKRTLFDHYTGNGRFIAFMKKAGGDINRRMFIDRVHIDYISSCDDINRIDIHNIRTDGATFKPERIRSEQWEYIIAEREIRIDAPGNDDRAVIRIDTVSTDYPFELKAASILPGTDYVVYVRSLCDDGEAGQWSNA
ncbi:MAG: choice-of-anchor J domain-containing protein [Paludibacteraceae bacterium]|nr:choice-of-anchor J domain-containing protein [Paludibacteraceae bacterium]